MTRWDDLRLFLAVAREGTLAAAASTVGVDASTLHRRIGALEEAMEAKLFDKGPRGYLLTPLGEETLRRVEIVEDGVLAVWRGVEGHHTEVSGRVRLTMPPSLLPSVAPHLAAVAEAHPRLQLEVLTDAVMLELGRDTDVALRVIPQPPDEAIARKVATVAWSLFVGPGGDAGSPWVAYHGMDAVAAVRHQRQRWGKEAVLAEVSEVSAMGDLLSVLPARGLLPHYVGERLPRLRLLERVPQGDTALWLLVHTDHRRSARVRAVVDLLHGRLAADPCWGGAKA